MVRPLPGFAVRGSIPIGFWALLGPQLMGKNASCFLGRSVVHKARGESGAESILNFPAERAGLYPGRVEGLSARQQRDLLSAFPRWGCRGGVLMILGAKRFNLSPPAAQRGFLNEEHATS